jgi:hypothetical protein
VCLWGERLAAELSKSLTFHLVEKQAAFNFIDNPSRGGFSVRPTRVDVPRSRPALSREIDISGVTPLTVGLSRAA